MCVCFFVSFYFVCDHTFTFLSHGWCASLSLCNLKIINVFSSYWRNPWRTSHWPFYLPFHTITFHTLEPTTYEPTTLNNFTNEVSKLVWEEFCVIYQMVSNLTNAHCNFFIICLFILLSFRSSHMKIECCSPNQHQYIFEFQRSHHIE